MDPMSIAAISVEMHAYQSNLQMDTAVMKMAMDAQTTQMTELLDAVDVSSMTGVGMNLDIMA